MYQNPLLSIVTPTRGDFSSYWFNQLLQVEGNVQFILVYPPNISIKSTDNPRVLNLISPYKGEMMQRFIGILNASGKYILALDDDDLVHPNIAQLVTQYFQRFPDSWILRLQKSIVDFRDLDAIKKEWKSIPNVEQLEICRKTPETPNPYQNGKYTGLLEVPIAPLERHFDLRWLFWPFIERKDNYGYHFENFNNIVWKNEIVQQTLPDLSKATKVSGVITWIPNSGFDRLLGLFVQAKHYQKEAIIGHCMPGEEQIRYIAKPASMKPPRFHVFSDFLLVKYFPKYGYLWNLFFSKLYGVPRAFGKLMKLKLFKQA